MSLDPIRQIPTSPRFQAGDTLVLFGELFQRGYANGLVEQAQKLGMNIIYSTVGRRDKDLGLRPLNHEEILNLPKPLINVPLEAGFDEEACSTGETPNDFLKDAKLSNWETTKLDFHKIEESREKGHERFRQQVRNYLSALEEHLPSTGNVYFAHLMAGGIPRSKILMSIMNRVFKGSQDRYVSSQFFWETDIGKLCAISFNEVTADTLLVLLQETEALRKKLDQTGRRVSYSAYGYHGTEVLIGHQYVWQTYTPYLQGWAKKRMEDHAKDFFHKGVKVAVYNCPEILTASSSVFVGGEISLFPLLAALEKETSHSKVTQQILNQAQSFMKEGFSWKQLVQMSSDFLQLPSVRDLCNFEKWPQHSKPDVMEKMLQLCDEMSALQKTNKQEIAAMLSELVFQASAKIMITDIWHPSSAVRWIGHDVLAKVIAESNSHES